MKLLKKPTRLFAVLLLAPLLALAAFPARAAVDFSGKTIEWIVPFKEGGGTDRWARFYAPLLSEHLPGNPQVVVKNLPGGGSITGANQFARQAEPDGLTIFGSSSSTLFPYLLGDPRVEYDYADWPIVMISPTGGVVYVAPNLGVKTSSHLSELQRQRIVFGSQGPTSLDLIMLLAMDLLEIEIHPVFGMKGRGAARIAFERNESNIDHQTSAAYLKNVAPLVGKQRAVPVLTWGGVNRSGRIFRDPTFPKLPHFTEVFKEYGGDVKSPAYKAWKAFFAAGYPAQKMLFLPKGASDELVATYRQAFEEMFADESFHDKSEQVLGAYLQFTGERADQMKEIATTIDPDAREWVRNWLTEKYEVKFE